MAIVLPEGKQSFTTATGAPAVGWRLYAFVPGTSTPKDTYTTSVGDVPNTHPVVMDARGEAAIYWSGAYDVVLRDSADVLIWGPERLEDSGDSLRDDLANDSSASLGAGLVGLDQSLAYLDPATVGFWAIQQAICVTAAPFNADNTGVSDCAAAIQAANDLAKVLGKRVYFPAGKYLTTETLLCHVEWFGDGSPSAWGADPAVGGSIIITSGAGTAALWTDVNGTDADITPCIVLARDGAAVIGIGVRTVSPQWSVGIMNAGVRGCRLDGKVHISGHWTKAAILQDATWSKFNATLMAAQPNVEPNAGPLEFYVGPNVEVYGGLWGYLLEGSSRDPSLYVSDPTDPSGWVWGYGGTSDTLIKCRRIGSSGDLAVRQSGGGSVRISARMKNAATAAQGITFEGANLRTSSKYIADLDYCNRVIFIGGYAEAAATDLGFAPAFNVTSNMDEASGYGGVLLAGFRNNGPFDLDDVQVGATFDALAFADTRRISGFDHLGYIHTPAFTSRTAAELSVISPQTNGDIKFKKDTGSATPTVLTFSEPSISPEANGVMDLGGSSNRFRDIRLSRQIVLGTSVTISTGTGTPEGAVTANPGSIFLRTNGGAGTALYVKESGFGTNTGWVAK